LIPTQQDLPAMMPADSTEETGCRTDEIDSTLTFTNCVLNLASHATGFLFGARGVHVTVDHPDEALERGIA
jgi:hypothetical protein